MDVCMMVLGQEDVTWPDWLALAAACEAYGVGTLFTSDHYLSVEQGAERGSLDAWSTIAALGARTTELRLGTMVSPVTFRHPAVLAKAVTTADHVSGGRVELGIGAAWWEGEHEAYGFEMPPLRQRLDALEEQLQVIRGHWAPGRFDFAGAHYSARNLEALPKPVQQPRPPLVLGSRGGPRSIRLAARYADEYNVVFGTPETVADLRRKLDEACEAEGRDPATLPLSTLTIWLVGATRDELRERAARTAAWQGRSEDPDEYLASLPPEWIVGTVPEALESLRALADAGASRVMAEHLLHRDLDAVELLGREILPPARQL